MEPDVRTSSPRVSYERRGSGEPIVLVHGLGSRWQAFAPIIDLLAGDHEVIAVDLPGFGESEPDPQVTPGVDGYASWLERLLATPEFDGVERPHVVGNSMGGGIALELGRRGVASRVTAFSPIGFWGRPGVLWCQALLTVLRGTGAVSWPLLSRGVAYIPVRAALLGAVVAHPGRVSPDDARLQAAGLIEAAGFPGARNSFTGHRLTSAAAADLREVPVTIAWGTRDLLLTHATQSRQARRQLLAARHVDLPGCGHVPFADDPALCARVILDGA